MLIVNNRTYEVTVVGDGHQYTAETLYGDWRLVGRGRTAEIAVEDLRHEIEDADDFTSRDPDANWPRPKR